MPRKPDAKLVEFSDSDSPTPKRATVQSTTLPAQVGVARQLAGMKLPPGERPRQRKRPAQAKPRKARSPARRR